MFPAARDKDPDRAAVSMKLIETRLKGAYLVELQLLEDARGFFARTFCAREFSALGLDPTVDQCNLAYNRRRGTVRGLHYQTAPHPETKLVRCIRGAIHDVIVDARPGSPTYGEHYAVELSADNRRALYIPPMFAHGMQTLTDNAEIFYQMGGTFEAGSARGFRHDDPKLGIPWPLPVSVISDRDLQWPDFS